MDISIIVYVLAVLGAIGGIYSFTKGKKSKVLGMPKNITGLILVGIGVFLLALQMGWLAGLNSSLVPLSVAGIGVDNGGTSSPDSPLLADVTGCDLGTKTTITLSASDKYTSGATGGTHRYRINGAPALTVSDAGTLTASPGDVLSILWHNASTTGYYGKVDTFSVPCTGAKTFYTELVANGTITSSEKDSNDDTIDGTSNNQTLGAGDVKDVTVKLSGTYQADFPYGFIAVVEFNKTEIDDVILTQNGVELASASLPHTFSTTLDTASSTKVYVIPALISNGDLTFKATIDADDTYNPKTSDNVTITYFPKNYFIDDNNGGAFAGPSAEDEDNAVTRTGQYQTLIEYD